MSLWGADRYHVLMTPPEATKQRGRPRSEQSHQKVLEATARLLGSSSYDSISVERIAAEAGVGKQTIYRWWRNKAEVVLEAVLTGYVEMELVPMDDTGDLHQDLSAWMQGMLTEGFREEFIAMARSLMAAGLEGLPETAELIRQEHAWESGALMERLRRAAERDELRPGADIAAAASALIDPLLFRIVIGKPCAPAWGQALVDTVTSGIAADRPAR